MYGFPDNDALSFLRGAELSQICIGKNEIIFNFIPEGIRITITSLGEFYYYNRKHFSSIENIIRLIGKKIDSLETSDNKKRLEINLSDKDNIVLIDDSHQFESIIIEAKNNTLVI